MFQIKGFFIYIFHVNQPYLLLPVSNLNSGMAKSRACHRTAVINLFPFQAIWNKFYMSAVVKDTKKLGNFPSVLLASYCFCLWQC